MNCFSLSFLTLSGTQGVSVSSSGSRVADLQPLGRVNTVQVEVEPEADNIVDNKEDSEPEQPIASVREEMSHLTTKSTVSDLHSPPPPPPPASTPTRAKATPSDASAMMPDSTVAEGLEEAARRVASTKKKRSGKSKPLSVKDLMPLHQDVGRSNRQLVEPLSPDFQPTPEWVCACILVCHCVGMHVCSGSDPLK